MIEVMLLLRQVFAMALYFSLVGFRCFPRELYSAIRA